VDTQNGQKDLKKIYGLKMKNNILDRFEMLVKLCEETEPDIPSEKYLFTGQLIAAKEMYDRLETGVSYSENELPALMRQANKIWKIRNKIKIIYFKIWNGFKLKYRVLVN